MTNTTKLPKSVDMSSETIDRRLRDVSQLYKLGKSLASARKIGKVKELESHPSQEPSSPKE